MTALLRHLLLASGAVIMLAPFVWLLSLAVKPPDEIFTSDLHLLPRRWDAERNFTQAFAKVPFKVAKQDLIDEFEREEILITGGFND